MVIELMRMGAWQQVLRNKYLSNKLITQVDKKPGNSQFWTGLMNVKNQFLSFGNFRLQDDKQVRFWEVYAANLVTICTWHDNLHSFWPISIKTGMIT